MWRDRDNSTTRRDNGDCDTARDHDIMQPDDSARDTTHGTATATATHGVTTVTATPHVA